MAQSKPREYTIQVQQTVVFYANVVVTAETEEEAREFALEGFQCDWSKSDEVDTTTHLIALGEP